MPLPKPKCSRILFLDNQMKLSAPRQGYESGNGGEGRCAESLTTVHRQNE